MSTYCIPFRVATHVQPFVTDYAYAGSIAYVEHVIVEMTLVTDYHRGDVRIELISPSGTESMLLDYRPKDTLTVSSYQKYSNWPFMSLTFWGENPVGIWTLVVVSKTNVTTISVENIKMTFYGTSSVPKSVASIPNSCHSECARGCAAAGSRSCDACANLRNAYTLECIARCPSGYTERNGYCYSRSEPVPVCDPNGVSLPTGMYI